MMSMLGVPARGGRPPQIWPVGQWAIVQGVGHEGRFVGVPFWSSMPLESSGPRAWGWLHALLPAGEGQPLRDFLRVHQDWLVTGDTPDLMLRYALIYEWQSGRVVFLQHTAPGPRWVVRFFGTLDGPPPEWDAIAQTPPGAAPPWPSRPPQAAREQPWGEERG